MSVPSFRNWLQIEHVRQSADAIEAMTFPSHIPFGAIEKTEYVFTIAPYFADYAPESRFFAFDGKVYSLKPESLFNGRDWHEFCEEIKPKEILRRK